MIIKKIQSFEDIEVIICSLLKEQGNLEKSQVLNAESVRGINLSIQLTETKEVTFNNFNVLLLFRIEEKGSDFKPVSEEWDNGIINEYSEYSCHIIIYGNKANQLAHILQARIESEEVRYQLWLSGIHFINFSQFESTEEYINETFTPRMDLTFNFDVRMEIEKETSFHGVKESDIYIESLKRKN